MILFLVMFVVCYALLAWQGSRHDKDLARLARGYEEIGDQIRDRYTTLAWHAALEKAAATVEARAREGMWGAECMRTVASDIRRLEPGP